MHGIIDCDMDEIYFALFASFKKNKRVNKRNGVILTLEFAEISSLFLSATQGGLEY